MSSYPSKRKIMDEEDEVKQPSKLKLVFKLNRPENNEEKKNSSTIESSTPEDDSLKSEETTLSTKLTSPPSSNSLKIKINTKISNTPETTISDRKSKQKTETPKTPAINHLDDNFGKTDSEVEEEENGDKLRSQKFLPLRKTLSGILNRMIKQDTLQLFYDPVSPEEVPDYHSVIKNPMDFSTMKKKLRNGEYTNLELFENDFHLVCDNAMLYNNRDTIYHKEAERIKKMGKKIDPSVCSKN